MIQSNIDLILNAVIIVSALLSIIYTFGVVWRVEKKLDISYKLFLAAIFSFTASVILEFLNTKPGSSFGFWALFARAVFALFFLAGIWTMRSLIRKIDGEK